MSTKKKAPKREVRRAKPPVTKAGLSMSPKKRFGCGGKLK